MRDWCLVGALLLAGTTAAAQECAVVQALDGSPPFVSDASECAVKTAPAST